MGYGAVGEEQGQLELVCRGVLLQRQSEGQLR